MRATVKLLKSEYYAVIYVIVERSGIVWNSSVVLISAGLTSGTHMNVRDWVGAKNRDGSDK